MIMGKYMKFYRKCMLDPNQLMPHEGLCDCFGIESLDIFRPDGSSVWAYWASDSPGDYYKFNETRQTIVLFLAAMSGELTTGKPENV